MTAECIYIYIYLQIDSLKTIQIFFGLKLVEPKFLDIGVECQ
jgi:hypothetical protein